MLIFSRFLSKNAGYYSHFFVIIDREAERGEAAEAERGETAGAERGGASADKHCCAAGLWPLRLGRRCENPGADLSSSLPVGAAVPYSSVYLARNM